MSVDITSLQVKVASEGIKEASNSLSGLSTSSLNSERRINSLTEAMKRLNTTSSSLSSVNSVINSTIAALNNATSANNNFSKSNVSQALVQQRRDVELYNQAAKAYSAAQTEAIAMNKAFDASARQAASGAMQHNASMREGHALARGLSGSLGALWVTYGAFTGMAVGLAIGTSLKGIISIGKDVEQTLESIRVKGQETVSSVSAVRESVFQLSTGIYGPLAVAKAFETFTLAGLNASQSLNSINDALNLAIVGSTSIETSAFTLVQVGTALDYSAAGYSRIADVISKTAAVSMSSVESLSEAFKSGSVVGKLYGVTLVDMGTSLAALSNLGIQRGAAGTSLKNMYKELASEADKVKNALKLLDLTPDSFKDAQGNFLNLVDVIKKLSDGLDTLKAPAQKKVLAELANERGMKNLVEVLGLYRDKIQQAGDGADDFKNKLQALNKEIENSYGFAAIGAAAMALTVDAQFKSVKNSFETTLVKAFQGIQPEISLVATQLKAAFNSQEFINGIQSLATAAAKLAVILVENASAIYDIVRAIIAFKAASFVAGLLLSIAEGFVAVKTAMDFAKISSIAFQASLGLLGIALAASAALFVWWSTKRDEATNSPSSKAALNYMDDFKGKLDEEAKRLNRQTELMKQGTDARKAETRAIQEQQLELVRLSGLKVVDEAQKNLKTAKESLNSNQVKALNQYKTTGVLPYYSANEKEIRQVLAAEKELQAAQDTTTKKYAANKASMDALVKAAETNAKVADEQAAKARKSHSAGIGDIPSTQKIKSEGLLKVNTALEANAVIYQDNVRSLDQEIALDKLRKKYKMESAQDIYQSIVDAENKRIAFMEDAREKDLKAIELYNHKDTNLVLQANQKKDAINKKYNSLVGDANLAKEKARIEMVYANQEADRQLEKNRQKELEDVEKNITAISAQVKAYDDLPEAIKKAGVTEKQLHDNITQVKIDNLYKQREAIVANGDITDAYDRKALEHVNNMIAKEEELRNLQFSKELQQAQQKAIADYNEEWKKSNKQFSDDLADAIINGGGNGWKKLLNDMKMGFAKLVLQPILAPISGALATGTAQAQATIANMAGGNASASNSSLGALSTAYNMYKAISSGFNNVGSTVSNSIISAGNALGFGDTAGLNGYDVVDNPLTNVAGTAGTVASYASGAIAGKKLGSAISDGYQVGNHGSAIVNVSTVIGSVLGGPIGGAIGGTIGGLINRAFGMSAKEVTSQGIRGSLSSEAVTGESFSNWHQSGGWFRSDKNGTDITQLSASTLNTLKQGFVSLQNTSINFAESLALSGDTIKGFSKDFNITLTNDSENNQKAISEFFVQLGDELATKLVPNIAEFALINESASTTLQRLSTVFKATDTVATILGRKVEDVFGGIGLASDKARERLVNLFGGLDSLGSSMTFYAQNFLTTAEKIAPVQQSLSASLNDLNLGWVKTIDQFKSVLAGLDLTNEAQAQQFYSLMKLAPAFKEVADYTDALATNAITLTSAQQRLKDSASADFAVVSKAITKAKEVSKAEFDAQTAIINAKKSSAETVFNDTKKAITDTLNTAKTANQAIAELSSSLSRTLDSMTLLGTEAESRTNAQGIILAALETAKSTGVLPTSDSLSKSLSIVAQSSTDLFSTYEEYAKDFQLTKNVISDLNGLTGARKTSSDLQLAALENSLTLLQSNYDLQLTQFTEEQAAAQAKYDGEIAKYDSILSIAQQQLDIMNGSYVAIKELSSAMIAFAESSRAAITAIQPSTTVPTTNTSVPYTKPATKSEIEGLYQTILGRAPDQEGLDWWVNNVAQNGFSLATVAGDFYKSTEYQTMHGSHADGLDYVPFDNYRANLHAGERVLTAKASKDADSTAEEIRQMRMEMNAALLSVAQNTGVSSKLMRQWDGDGIPPVRVGT